MNKRPFRIILNLVLICGLIAPSIIVRPNSAWGMTDEPSASTFRLYLTHVLRQNQADRVRLRNLGVVTLAEEENDLTLVIVTGDQLEDLARLNFRPHNTQDLAYLLEKGAVPGWLRTSLHPLLVKAVTLDQELARHPEGLSDDALVMQAELGNMLYGLTAEQKLGLAKLDTVDSDNDGLNDTEEDWWCTDPTDPDSDDDGVEDGQEVDQLMAGNKTNGKPFLDWPPNIPGCYDDDQDSVPDLAETNVVGLNVNRESSDLDKYDDGQEFFGSTYCPGGAGACGYGTLPRTDDLYLGSNMPSFVEAPADSPFVAAFPDPSVSVVDGSLNVEAVTVVTTDHTIEESESHYYSTTTTSGTSTTTTDVESWNDWEEVPTTDSEVAATFHDIGLHLDNIESRLSPDAALTIGTIIAGAGLLLAVSPAIESNMNIMDRFCYRDRPFLLGGAQCKAHEWLYGPPQKTGETITNITNNYYQTNYGTSTCDTSGQQPQGDTCNAEGMYAPSYGKAILTDSNSPDRQESPITQEGMNYHTDANNELIGNRSYSGSYPSTTPDQDPVYTIEFDGRRSTTTYEYSETTITQREEFSSFESWSEATAVDSAHAADLRFTYAILNDGTDILREMDELLFNIYLGGDPNPIYTYNAIADTGTLSNINPGDEVTIASQPIPLTLQQMKAIDQGASILITVEQVAYGGDQVFFEDAVNGGLTVGVEDGWADGDDVFDLYVLPCFGNPCGSDPNETVQTIVQRGFTTEEDPNGNLLSITTPEVDGSAVDWVEHRLDYTSWWNFYLSDNLEYTGAFSTTMPLAGEAVVMRFLDDTDLDGYNDRTETILGTDPDDAGSHPQPELLAGAVSERTGDDVKVTMAFLNTGPYDATGVEVVAYAPDDTITLHDNTIGGSGRVGSGNRVVLGGRVKDPVVDNWTGSATPMSSGVFSGTVDTTYTFTAQGGGDIGSGNLLIDWNDGVNSGSLQVGDGYLSPLPLDVGDLGVQVAFNTGTVNAGDSFTVDVRPPGDTITYTVTSEPYTPPVLVVSYNDPQGNHRFITPITMTTVSDDLSVYSGEMIEDLELSITTVAEFDETGTNTTYYITNSPDEATIEDAHLFAEYINDEGHVVAEQVFTDTLPPGPTVWQVDWDTSIFTETFSTAEDYTILALWTDGQGDIIDTSVRPLSSFQEDPLPEVAHTGEAWDFGDVYVGEPVYQEFVAGNTGNDNLAVLAATDVVSSTLRGDWRTVLSPTESATFGLQIDTSSPGPVNGSVTLRTNDVNTPEVTIPVTGTILQLPNLLLNDEDITFSNNYPIENEEVTVSAAVQNNSDHTVEGITVRFFSGDPLADGVQIGEDQVVASMEPGSETSVSTAWIFTPGKNHIHAKVDPDNTIAESNEHDNDARAFLNIEYTLPDDGVLQDQRVFHVSESTQLTSTVVVTDYATLMFTGVTGSLDSLTFGDGASIIADSSQLDIQQIGSTDEVTATLFILRNNSVISSTKPIVIEAHRIELDDSQLRSEGPDGADGASYESGEPGSPGEIALNATKLVVRNVVLTATGGDGGDANQYFDGGPGGSASIHLEASRSTIVVDSHSYLYGGTGGVGGTEQHDGGEGGDAALSMIASGEIELSNSDLQVFGGVGGAGSVGGGNGGNGARGGSANAMINTDGLSVAEGSFSLVGGSGGSGGSAASSHDDGGDGGLGGDAELEIFIQEDAELKGSIYVLGGDGGNGRPGGDCDVSDMGGSGGTAGSGTVEITSEKLLGNIDVEVLGGNGGIGEQGTSGGDGGHGGWSTSVMTATRMLSGITSSVVAGDGGNGGEACGRYYPTDIGGSGGNGGNAVSQLYAPRIVTQLISTTIQSGNGGNGAYGQDVIGAGGNGGDLDADWDADFVWNSNSEYWYIDAGDGGDEGAVGSPPGESGTLTYSLANSNQASSGGNNIFSLDMLSPTIFDPSRVVSATIQWDDNSPQVIGSPYEVMVPYSAGYHWLTVDHYFVDTVPVTSQHRFYVYGEDSDEDGDGVLDIDENEIFETDPLLPDTDDDGLNDGNEIAAQTDLNNPDSDYDGILDGEDPEVLYDPELSLEAGSPFFSNPDPTEGDLVTLSSTVSNSGSNIAEGVIVAFYDGDPDNGGLYICSDFIVGFDVTESDSAECVWDTSGRTGSHEVYAVVDPNNRIVEEDEDNNSAHASLYIRTKPDLAVDSISPSTPEVLAGETITFTSVISNTGETDAGAHAIDFLEDGTLFGSDSLSIPGESSDVAEATWSPTAPGPYTITVKADSGDVVTESDETNNELDTSAYVGFAGSIELDCGGDSAVDPAYTPEGGYGYLNGDATTFCGTEPEQSQRNDWNGAVEYRFDRLLPSHRYHLDIILYECDGLGRQEQVLVDGNLISGVEDLSDGQIHELSFLLDPVMYDDHSIVVRIEELIGYDAVVSQINLHNIDYRYIDAGGGDDPAYSPEIGYGWLDGVAQSPWGDDPYKSRRIDLGDDDPNDDPDNELRYQFDNLDPTSNYELHLTFYQGAGGLSQQSIAIDDIDTGIVVELDGEQRVDQTVYISPSAYAEDGSVILRITRTNATAAAFVNELVLEQVTSGVPQVVTDLSISEDAGQVHLEWTDVGRGVEHYEVWRSQSPYFTPGTASAELIAPDVPANPGGTVTYTDATSYLNNPDINDYYLVLAVKSGRTSAASNPVAAFDYQLTPGGN